MTALDPDYQAKWYQRNRERELAKQKQYQQNNKEKVQAYQKDWYQKNKERIRAQQKEWDATDRGRMLRLVRVRKRQALVANRTCDCCTQEDFEKMYTSARQAGMEVDHIHPLSKGGLHCTQNMQLLTMTENRQKHAKVA